MTEGVNRVVKVAQISSYADCILLKDVNGTTDA
jgi:hypothetical protein